jgi:hypothetical protein
VRKAGDEVLVEVDQEAVRREGGLLDAGLHLEGKLVPELLVVELAQLRQLRRQRGPAARRLRHPLHISVRHDCPAESRVERSDQQ